MNDATRLLRHANRLLLLLLVGLKLTGDLTWSWWAILAPAWVPFCLIPPAGAAMVLVVLYRRHIGGGPTAAPQPQHRPLSHAMTVRQSFAARR